MIESKVYDCIVIGKGLIGSAAIKYLSQRFDSVALIGQPEPNDFKNHNGVFASHYDSGRITRILDGDRSCFWAQIAKESIARYKQIEADSGIKFFNPVGCIKIAPNNQDGIDYIQAHKFVGDKLKVSYKSLDSKALLNQFPFLNFPDDSICLLESKTAGWINPRYMIEAQVSLAKQNAAKIIDDTAIGVNRLDSHFQVKTLSGVKLSSKNILVTAGAFSNFHNLTAKKLDIMIRGESIALGELSEESARLHQSMPSIVWPIDRGKVLSHVYIVPVVSYPDGKNYIKVGAKSKDPLIFKNQIEVTDWFHSEGKEAFNQELVKVMTELMPKTDFLSWQFKPCIITDTISTRPILEEVEENLYVATGGNGYRAKSSDQLGKMAADML